MKSIISLFLCILIILPVQASFKDKLKRALPIVLPFIAPLVVIPIAVVSESTETIENPIEVVKNSGETSIDTVKRTGKELYRGGDRIIEEAIRIVLDAGQLIFCPKESKLTDHSGYCFSSDKTMSCTVSDGDTTCEVIDIGGNNSGPGSWDGLNQQVEIDWNEALAWMRKTEVQDYLESFKNGMDSNLKNLLNQNEDYEVLRDLAMESFKSAKEKTLNGTDINVENEKQMELLAVLKGLMTLAKGIDKGSSDSFQKAFFALANPLKTYKNTEKALTALFNYVGSVNNAELFDNVTNALMNNWDEFSRSPLDKKGEIIGTIGFDFLSMYVGSAYLTSLSSGSFLAIEGTIFSNNIESLVNSAKKLGLNSKEGIKDFADLSNRIIGNRFGKITDYTKILNGKTTRFSPVSKGPLSSIPSGPGKTVADSFRSSSYFSTIIQEPTKLYRVYGGNAEELSRYWSRVKPTGSNQATFDSALLPDFRNTAQKWVEITIPKGVTVYDGIASEMVIRSSTNNIKIGDLLGGGSQVYLDGVKIPRKWITNGGSF